VRGCRGSSGSDPRLCSSGASQQRWRSSAGPTDVGRDDRPPAVGGRDWRLRSSGSGPGRGPRHRIAHEPLVDDATFVAVQRMRAGRQTKEGNVRQYVLAGLVVCGACGRRMDAHWVRGRPGYCCRHGHSSATPRPTDAARNVYVREDHLLDALPSLIDDIDGASNETAGGTTQADPIERLSHRGLQIVYSHQHRELRPTAASPEQRKPLLLARQPTLALDWKPELTPTVV
jgi:recombinase-like zinc beta ribbon protein